MTNPKLRRIAWAALAVTLAVSCAPGSASADPAEDAKTLKDRVQKFWEARVQDQWEVVFDLMSLEEQQMANDREKFAAYQREKGWFKYTDVKLGEAFVDKDLGWVEVTFTTGLRQYPAMPPQTSTLWDVWRKVDGTWRPVPQPLLEQFPKRPPAVRSAEDETALTARVHALWNARQAQDWGTIYDMLDPVYRAANPKEEFLKRRSKYRYLRHKIEWVEVNGAQARGKVYFQQILNDPTLHKLEPPDEAAIEPWAKIDGQWYRVMEKPKGGS